MEVKWKEGNGVKMKKRIICENCNCEVVWFGYMKKKKELNSK
jgi:hypothetical protein